MQVDGQIRRLFFLNAHPDKNQSRRWNACGWFTCGWFTGHGGFCSHGCSAPIRFRRAPVADGRPVRIPQQHQQQQQDQQFEPKVTRLVCVCMERGGRWNKKITEKPPECGHASLFFYLKNLYFFQRWPGNGPLWFSRYFPLWETNGWKRRNGWSNKVSKSRGKMVCNEEKKKKLLFLSVSNDGLSW